MDSLLLFCITEAPALLPSQKYHTQLQLKHTKQLNWSKNKPLAVP